MSVYGIPISQSFGTLEKYQGGFILVVNIADQCGFSPQLKDLELLHAHPNNLCQVMAFPSDQFNQQSKDDAQMQSWCQVQKLSFFVSPVVSVNGEFTHPLFAYLKKEAKGWFGQERIMWNYTKFLIYPNEERIIRFAPMTKIDTIIDKIEKKMNGVP